MRLLGRVLRALLILFMESFFEEVDKSFMEILQYYQKSCFVFDLGIRLTVIQEKVTGIKYRTCTVFPRKSSWCGCHAQLSYETTICLKSNWCSLISKVDIGMFAKYIFIGKVLAQVNTFTPLPLFALFASLFICLQCKIS